MTPTAEGYKVKRIIRLLFIVKLAPRTDMIHGQFLAVFLLTTPAPSAPMVVSRPYVLG